MFRFAVAVSAFVAFLLVLTFFFRDGLVVLVLVFTCQLFSVSLSLQLLFTSFDSSSSSSSSFWLACWLAVVGVDLWSLFLTTSAAD